MNYDEARRRLDSEPSRRSVRIFLWACVGVIIAAIVWFGHFVWTFTNEL